MDDQPTTDQLVRVTQIVAFALSAGVAIFAAVILWISRGRAPAGSMLSYIGLGVAVMAVVLSQVIPTQVGKPTKENSEFELAQMFQTRTIIGLALLEAAAFFNGIAFFQEHHSWTLAVVFGLLFVMLTRFPTRARVMNWIEAHTAFDLPK